MQHKWLHNALTLWFYTLMNGLRDHWPNDIPYQLYKRCPQVLKELWKLIRAIWKQQHSHCVAYSFGHPDTIRARSIDHQPFSKHYTAERKVFLLCDWREWPSSFWRITKSTQASRKHQYLVSQGAQSMRLLSGTRSSLLGETRRTSMAYGWTLRMHMGPPAYKLCPGLSRT